MMKKLVSAAVVLALCSGVALAQSAADASMTEGEVRKLDKEGGKITLKHAEIRNLGMPPMTMVFRVGDPALLQGLQPGAKVRFRAEQDGSTYRVTAIEPVK